MAAKSLSILSSTPGAGVANAGPAVINNSNNARAESIMRRDRAMVEVSCEQKAGKLGGVMPADA
jgi:hypothetical protein